MPNREYAIAMARYNIWQNVNMLSSISSLSPQEREKDREAFFGSIQNTVSHIYWGDRIWMSRFSDKQKPEGGIVESVELAKDWERFCSERTAFDREILQWAREVSPDWFNGNLSWYSGAVGREVKKEKKLLVVHMFNHQTHHRGQVHAMLTSAGAKTEDTDLPFMPDSFLEL